MLLTISALGQAEDYHYTTNNGAITITEYTGSGGAVAIPSEVNGLPVTSIGVQAFIDCWNLTSVTIPNSVTNIGGESFWGCGLTSVTIPNSVTSMGDGPFAGCPKLTAIAVDALSQFYTSLDGVLFNKSQTAIIQYPAGKAGSDYAIPNSVTNIGGEAFGGCGVSSVTIPNSVTSIGGGAFWTCTSLNAITVSTNSPAYTSVGGVLFNKGQTALIQFPPGQAVTSYAIPNSVTSIGGGAFDYCTGLTSITIPDGVTNIGGEAFISCIHLISVTIPNGVTSIGEDVFYGCWNLASVMIPDSVASIGQDAFGYCTSLTSLTIPSSVASIRPGAFDYCTSLTSVLIGKGVTNIGGGTFYGCTSLTGVYFQGNAPSPRTDSFMFEGDKKATVYYLPWTTGWGPTFDGVPTALWNQPPQASLAITGARLNPFGFTVTGTSGLVVVVEACTSLANPAWLPLGTNTLSGGSWYFADPQWTNYPVHFYRLRSP